MEKNNYKEFIVDFKDYLIVIKNLSNIYIEKIVTTVHQFLEFVNIYKLDNKYDSIENFSLNDVRTLTNKDIYSYIFYLAENDYKQGSRNIKIEHLRSFFNYLFHIMHNIFRQPFDIVKTEKREVRQLPNYLSLREAKKLVTLYKDSDKVNEVRNNAIFNLCLNCGLRISEISALNIDDIDFKYKKFIIHGKGKKERMGYLNDVAYDAMIKYYEIRKNLHAKNKKDEKAFFLSNKGVRLSTVAIRKATKIAYRKSDIDSIEYSVHTMRHTCATLMFKSGVDVKTIQEILGHSQINTTKIYTHLHDEEVMKSMLDHPLSQFKMKDAYAYSVA